jgi:integrase/recombinase XerD
MTELPPMPEIERSSEGDDHLDEAEVAAAAFLARYQGRTLEAYRYTCGRSSSGRPMTPSTSSRPRGHRSSCTSAPWRPGAWPASTIDRRLSTVCGFYRFAHIDGRTASNPAQYVRRPKVHPNDARGLDRAELGRFLFKAERVDHAHAALAVLLSLNGLRVSEACSADIENLGFERGHRTLRIVGKGNKAGRDPARTQDGEDNRPGHRRTRDRSDPAPPRRQPPG